KYVISFLLKAGSTSRGSWITADNEHIYPQLAENFRNFLTKNNTAHAGINRANNSNKYAKSLGSS
ncbi:MAG: hypothetical protein ACRD5B_08575, partial [Nitrososphaeraceae archaeon]